MIRRELVLKVLELVDVEDDRIYVQIEQERPYTFAKLSATDIEGCSGIGFSKVCFPDRWRPELGVQIATAKAAKALADEIENGEKRL
jgi:hypothetical protein